MWLARASGSVANLLSAISADEEISAFTIVESAIIDDVTVPDGNVTVPVKVGEARLALRSKAV